MELFIIPFIILITLKLLNRFTKDKTTNQLMLLGVEITTVGVGLLLLSSIFSSNIDVPNFFLISAFCDINSSPNFLLGLGILLLMIGFTVNIFGFRRK